ncbi:unnamed protein product [Amoebophrya sp. A120]|nr:unnamed protein product [Amoebophrya sp. A120]|eukprot:GSA120T00018108001.1
MVAATSLARRQQSRGQKEPRVRSSSLRRMFGFSSSGSKAKTAKATESNNADPNVQRTPTTRGGNYKSAAPLATTPNQSPLPPTGEKLSRSAVQKKSYGSSVSSGGQLHQHAEQSQQQHQINFAFNATGAMFTPDKIKTFSTTQADQSSQFADKDNSGRNRPRVRTGTREVVKKSSLVYGGPSKMTNEQQISTRQTATRPAPLAQATTTYNPAARVPTFVGVPMVVPMPRLSPDRKEEQIQNTPFPSFLDLEKQRGASPPAALSPLLSPLVVPKLNAKPVVWFGSPSPKQEVRSGCGSTSGAPSPGAVGDQRGHDVDVGPTHRGSPPAETNKQATRGGPVASAGPDLREDIVDVDEDEIATQVVREEVDERCQDQKIQLHDQQRISTPVEHQNEFLLDHPEDQNEHPRVESPTPSTLVSANFATADEGEIQAEQELILSRKTTNAAGCAFTPPPVDENKTAVVERPLRPVNLLQQDVLQISTASMDLLASSRGRKFAMEQQEQQEQKQQRVKKMMVATTPVRSPSSPWRMPKLNLTPRSAVAPKTPIPAKVLPDARRFSINLPSPRTHNLCGSFTPRGRKKTDSNSQNGLQPEFVARTGGFLDSPNISGLSIGSTPLLKLGRPPALPAAAAVIVEESKVIPDSANLPCFTAVAPKTPVEMVEPAEVVEVLALRPLNSQEQNVLSEQGEGPPLRQNCNKIDPPASPGSSSRSIQTAAGQQEEAGDKNFVAVAGEDQDQLQVPSHQAANGIAAVDLEPSVVAACENSATSGLPAEVSEAVEETPTAVNIVEIKSPDEPHQAVNSTPRSESNSSPQEDEQPEEDDDDGPAAKFAYTPERYLDVRTPSPPSTAGKGGAEPGQSNKDERVTTQELPVSAATPGPVGTNRVLEMLTADEQDEKNDAGAQPSSSLKSECVEREVDYKEDQQDHLHVTAWATKLVDFVMTVAARKAAVDHDQGATDPMPAAKTSRTVGRVARAFGSATSTAEEALPDTVAGDETSTQGASKDNAEAEKRETNTAKTPPTTQQIVESPRPGSRADRSSTENTERTEAATSTTAVVPPSAAKKALVILGGESRSAEEEATTEYIRAAASPSDIVTTPIADLDQLLLVTCNSAGVYNSGSCAMSEAGSISSPACNLFATSLSCAPDQMQLQESFYSVCTAGVPAASCVAAGGKNEGDNQQKEASSPIEGEDGQLFQSPGGTTMREVICSSPVQKFEPTEIAEQGSEVGTTTALRPGDTAAAGINASTQAAPVSSASEVFAEGAKVITSTSSNVPVNEDHDEDANNFAAEVEEPDAYASSPEVATICGDLIDSLRDRALLLQPTSPPLERQEVVEKQQDNLSSRVDVPVRDDNDPEQAPSGRFPVWSSSKQCRSRPPSLSPDGASSTTSSMYNNSGTTAAERKKILPAMPKLGWQLPPLAPTKTPTRNSGNSNAKSGSTLSDRRPPVLSGTGSSSREKSRQRDPILAEEYSPGGRHGPGTTARGTSMSSYILQSPRGILRSPSISGFQASPLLKLFPTSRLGIERDSEVEVLAKDDKSCGEQQTPSSSVASATTPTRTGKSKMNSKESQGHYNDKKSTVFVAEQESGASSNKKDDPQMRNIVQNRNERQRPPRLQLNLHAPALVSSPGSCTVSSISALSNRSSDLRNIRPDDILPEKRKNGNSFFIPASPRCDMISNNSERPPKLKLSGLPPPSPVVTSASSLCMTPRSLSSIGAKLELARQRSTCS